MWGNDELDYFTDPYSGDRMVKMTIGSNMLPKITVDTYGIFTTDSHEEYELDYLSQGEESWMGRPGRLPYDLNWGDYDFKYDFESFLNELSEQCVASMNSNGYQPTPFTAGEVLSTYSPAAYNFATDSFEAEYTLNLSELIRWATSTKDGVPLEFWVEGELRRRFSSRDGFISHITPALERDEERLGTLIWGLFYLWMEMEFDEDEWFMEMCETLGEICMDTVRIQLTEEGWEKNKDAVVANGDDHLLPDDDDIKAEYAALVAERDKYRQKESLF